MIICLVGCALSSDSQKEELTNSDDSNQLGDDSAIEEGTEPKDQFFEYFYTFDEMEKWFTVNEEGIAPAMAEMELHGKFYQEFISDMLSGDIRIIKPYWGDNHMEFRNKDGFFNIHIFCVDGKRPSIWYFCKVGDLECRIDIMYMTEDEIAYSKEHTIDEMRKYIYPSAIALDEIQGNSVYKDMYIEDMILKDRTISVLNYERYDDERVYRTFVYDNLYVELIGYKAVFEEKNWEEFSLRGESEN